MFETISSIQNPRVKNLVRLREGSHRRRQKKFLIEGYRELSRAIACKWSMESIFFCDELFKDPDAFELIEQCEDAGMEIIRMTPEAFAKSSYRQGPDGLLATAHQRAFGIGDLQLPGNALVVVVEALEKPGNLGAIFRTAEAAGADALILTNPITDPYNPNVIRASQGAFFGLPFYQTENAELFVYMEENGIVPILTSPRGEKLLWEAGMTGATAIVLGSEDEGLSDDWMSNYPAYRIPMEGITDSLNVGAMAAIALFEAVRQRTSQSS